LRVLVIPEDPRLDQYVLKPILEAMFKRLGRPRAIVRVCQDPVLGGVDQATNWNRIEEILDLYRGMVDIFLLIVDRDGQDGRRSALDSIEEKAREALPPGRHFLAENAWQEIEVWVLAGLDLPAGWSWQDVRTEPHAKETYFMPFARKRGVVEEPGEGRKRLTLEAAARYDRIRRLCPEDVASLEDRLAKLLVPPGLIRDAEAPWGGSQVPSSEAT